LSLEEVIQMVAAAETDDIAVYCEYLALILCIL